MRPIAARTMRPEPSATGFTLVELLLAAALGVLVCGVALQLLIGDAARSGALAETLRLRRLQGRTLALLQLDLAQAGSWQVAPVVDPAWPCSIGTRQPLIAITPQNGTDPVVYSLGTAPSGLWRGRVLMRCGPAFDLQGQPSSHGVYLNRVVLDRVEAFRIEQDPQLPLLHLELEQRGRGRDQLVRSSAVG